jgi:hypothetical protein
MCELRLLLANNGYLFKMYFRKFCWYWNEGCNMQCMQFEVSFQMLTFHDQGWILKLKLQVRAIPWKVILEGQNFVLIFHLKIYFSFILGTLKVSKVLELPRNNVFFMGYRLRYRIKGLQHRNWVNYQNKNFIGLTYRLNHLFFISLR